MASAFVQEPRLVIAVVPIYRRAQGDDARNEAQAFSHHLASHNHVSQEKQMHGQARVIAGGNEQIT